MPGKPRINGRSSYKLANPQLDEVNLALLRELAAEPRMTMSELARRVDMSAPAVTERVQKLEQAGVIAGYRMDIDPAALGLPITVFVRIKAVSGKLDRFSGFVASVPQVTECYRITGDDCFLLRMQIASVDRLGELLDRFLPYGQTTSSVVVATPIAARPLPLPAIAE